MGFSFAGTACFVTMITLTLIFLFVIAVINLLQAKKPELLPEKLRTWEFLPPYLRSLEPMDRLICLPMGQWMAKTMPFCCSSKKVPQTTVTSSSSSAMSSATSSSS